MNNGEFVGWAQHHSEVFGLTNEEFNTVLSWERYFVANGFHHHDLEEATRVLAADPPFMVRMAGEAKYLGKTTVHLAALEKFMRDGMARTFQRQAETYASEHGDCTVCSGTGRVVVPHHASIKRGQWAPIRVGKLPPYFATCAVMCSCALGKWMADKQGGPIRGTNRKTPRALSLELYENLNPDWHRQLAARDEAMRQRQRLRNPRIDADITAALQRFGINQTLLKGVTT